MESTRCHACGRLLNITGDPAQAVEGYYLFVEKAFCTECWENGTYKAYLIESADDSGDGRHEGKDIN